jgi:hypothetical protein
MKPNKRRGSDRRIGPRRRTLLIPEWRRAYRMLSVWLTAAIGSLAGLYEFVPTVKAWLPDGPFHVIMVTLAIAAIIGRLINQAPKA